MKLKKASGPKTDAIEEQLRAIDAGYCARIGALVSKPGRNWSVDMKGCVAANGDPYIRLACAFGQTAAFGDVNRLAQVVATTPHPTDVFDLDEILACGVHGNREGLRALLTGRSFLTESLTRLLNAPPDNQVAMKAVGRILGAAEGGYAEEVSRLVARRIANPDGQTCALWKQLGKSTRRLRIFTDDFAREPEDVEAYYCVEDSPSRCPALCTFVRDTLKRDIAEKPAPPD